MKFEIFIVTIFINIISIQNFSINERNLNIFAKAVNLSSNPGENCYRECKANDRRVCYYHWVVENYHTVGP
jgi:hypothetical protein